MRPISAELPAPLPDQLIVVDPSLRDYVGHHAQYDRAVLQAARLAAVPAVILAHREALRFVRIEGAIDPVFSQDIWRRRRVGARGSVVARAAMFRLCQAFAVVPFVMGPVNSAIRRGVPPSVRAFARRIVQALPEQFNRGSAITGMSEARKDGPPGAGETSNAPTAWALWGRRLQAVILFPFRAIGRYGALRIQKLAIPLGSAILFMSNPRYFFEAIDAIRNRSAQGRTQVFFHMVVADNLLESVLLAIWSGRNLKTPAALLFRYPPSLCLARRIRAKLAFRLLEQAFEAGSIRVLTDSQRLAVEYSEFCYVPMEVIPIPHGTQQDRGSRLRGKKIRIASLGNARAEKGILEILDAIEILRTRPIFDQLEFVLQVNDPSEDCRDRIDRWARSNAAHRIEPISGSLDAAAYSALLESVDLVLAPYWRDVYAARTSGILLDAVTCAKPVLVTADTWLSDELERWGSGLAVADRDPRALADGIERIAQDIESYSALAQKRAKASREFHSSFSFFQHLIGQRHSRFLRDRRVLVSYPWANLFLRNSGASVRSTLLIDALLRGGYAIAAHCTSPEEVAAADARIWCIRYGGTRSTVRAPLFLLATVIRLLGAPWQYEARDLWFRFEYWCRERSFRLLLNRVLYDCIAVFLEYPFLSEVVEPLCRGHAVPLIVSDLDVLSNQIENRHARPQLMRRETAAMRRATLAVCVSDADAQAFAEQGCPTQVIPNPIDSDATESMSNSSAREMLDRRRVRLPERFCLFVGSDHPPNREAAHRMAGFSLGAAPALGDMSFVTLGACLIAAPASPRFLQLGPVPFEVLAAAYSLAQFVLVPLTQGTGTSLKVIEAMAYGRVVIGTPSAFRGIPITDGADAIVVESPERMPDQIVELMRRPERMAMIGQDARRFALKFDYREVFRPYLSLLQDSAWRGPFGSGEHPEPTSGRLGQATKNESLA